MIRNSSNKISIRPTLSPQVRLAILTVVLFLLAGALYLSFDTGVRTGNFRMGQDRNTIEQLNSTIAKLRGELNTSQEQLVIAQRHQQIQEEAYKQINAAYTASEQKNRYLGSRLDFYRSIISPEDGQTGPAIQALVAKQEGSDIAFDVTLVQAIKHKHQVRGNLRVELYLDEQLVGQWPASNPRSVNFQYFQQVSGVIEAVELNDNARMRVEFTLQDGEPIERWFDLSSG